MVSAVNSPDDDLTSRIIGDGGVGTIQRYALDASAIPGGSTINSVSVRTRMSSFGANAALRQGIALGANATESAAIVSAGGYVWRTDTNVLARPGGGAWSVADMATLEAYVIVDADPSNPQVTSLRVEIDYTPGAATTGDMLLMF